MQFNYGKLPGLPPSAEPLPPISVFSGLNSPQLKTFLF